MFTDRLAMGLQGIGVLNPPAVGPAPVIQPAGTGTIGATACQDASGNPVDCTASTAIYCSGVACDPNVGWAGTGVPSTTAGLISDMQAGYDYLSSLLTQSSSATPGACADSIGCFTIGTTQIPETPFIIGVVALIAFVVGFSKDSGGRRR